MGNYNLRQFSFSTNNGNKYLYDSCSNQVFHINECDIEIIEHFIKNGDLEKENFMDRTFLAEKRQSNKKVRDWIDVDKAFVPKHIYAGFMSKDDFYKKIDNVQQLTLEVTTECNLRCKYCIYRDSFDMHREHGNKKMSWEIAKTSIDYYIERLKSKNRTYSLKAHVPMSFYGGEPLLNFKLIKQCVEYVKKQQLKDDFLYNITTNGTVLNKEMAKFFIENNFILTISLDGPIDIHDRNRVYKNGKGTFNSVLNTIKLIYDMDKDYFLQNVHYITVLSPDIDLDRVFEFFRQIKNKFNDSMRVRFISETTRKDYPKDIVLKNNQKRKKIRNEYIEFKKNHDYLDDIPDKYYFHNQLYYSDFIKMKKRFFLTSNQIPISGGSCIPGHRRIYVDTNGQFHMCEKINNSFPIGDCWKGVDYEKVKAIFLEFQKSILDSCHECHAINNCGICMAPVAGKGKFEKKSVCEYICTDFNVTIQDLYEILENNPTAFDEKIPFEEILNLK